MILFRYGLPVNFQAILIQPNKKSMKRLRDQLNQLYGHLDGSAAGGSGSANTDVSNFLFCEKIKLNLKKKISKFQVDMAGLGFGSSEYYPYVFYKLNIDMVENKPTI